MRLILNYIQASSKQYIGKQSGAIVCKLIQIYADNRFSEKIHSHSETATKYYFHH